MITFCTALKIWFALSMLMVPFVLACCVVAGRSDEASGCK